MSHFDSQLLWDLEKENISPKLNFLRNQKAAGKCWMLLFIPQQNLFTFGSWRTCNEGLTISYRVNCVHKPTLCIYIEIKSNTGEIKQKIKAVIRHWNEGEGTQKPGHTIHIYGILNFWDGMGSSRLVFFVLTTCQHTLLYLSIPCRVVAGVIFFI